MPDKTFHIKPPRKIGERYQYMDLTFWPKNGFIYVEDRSDNQFHTISRRDWLLRANSFVTEISKIVDVTTRADNEFQKGVFQGNPLKRCRGRAVSNANIPSASP